MQHIKWSFNDQFTRIIGFSFLHLCRSTLHAFATICRQCVSIFSTELSPSVLLRPVFHSLTSTFIQAFSVNFWLIVAWIRDTAFACSRLHCFVRDTSQCKKTLRWPLIASTIKGKPEFVFADVNCANSHFDCCIDLRI